MYLALVEHAGCVFPVVNMAAKSSVVKSCHLRPGVVEESVQCLHTWEHCCVTAQKIWKRIKEDDYVDWLIKTYVAEGCVPALTTAPGM